MATSPYANLALVIEEVQRYSESGDWDNASKLAESVGKLITENRLPLAVVSDRSHLESMLEAINKVVEKAQPLQEDTRLLLKAFGPDLPKD